MSWQVTLRFNAMWPTTFILPVSTDQSEHLAACCVLSNCLVSAPAASAICALGGGQLRTRILATVGLGFPGVVGWGGGPQSP